MKTVVKAFKVLEAFTPEKPELTFSEIVKSTGFGKTNTHKLLKTFVSLNCLAQSHSGGPYRHGPKLFELGSQFLATLNLRRVAMPYLVKLAEEFEDSSYLCIEDNGEALCLECIDGPSKIKITALQRGGRLPLHVGAAPLAILAGMEDEKIAAIMREKGFQKFTENTVSNMGQLMAKVRKARQQGYSVSWEDVTVGVASFGSQIRDVSGNAVGAISIGGILIRFEKKRKQYLIDLLMNSAQQISRELGHAS